MRAAEVLVSLGIVGFGIGFAVWWTKRSEKERAAKKADQARAEQNQAARESGLAIGDRPLPVLPARLLSDGLSDNEKWVDRRFRDAYWSRIDQGQGDAQALLHAMEVADWCEGSRGQVLDQMNEKRLISEGEKERLKRFYEAVLPDGYGICPGHKTRTKPGFPGGLAL